MFWISILAFVIYASLASAVIKYFDYGKLAFYFAVLSFFASFWGLGALIISFGTDMQFQFVGYVTFMIPPIFSSFFLVEYLNGFESEGKQIVKITNLILLPIQLLLGIQLVGQSQTVGQDSISGANYFVYTIYYLVIFSYAYYVYFRIKKQKNVNNTLKLNTLSLLFIGIFSTLFNIVLPSIGIVSFIWVGPLSGLVPLFTHVYFMYKHGELVLGYSFLRYFVSEILQSVLLVLILAILIFNYSELHLIDVSLFALLLYLVYSFALLLFKSIIDISEISLLSLDWGKDIRNSLSAVSTKIESASTEKELKQALINSFNTIEIPVLEVNFEKAKIDKEKIKKGGNEIYFGGSRESLGAIRLGCDVSSLSIDQRTLLSYYLQLVTLKRILITMEAKHKIEIEDIEKLSNEARKRLEESILTKDEFISIASHQLRTPLSIASLNNKLLVEGSYGALGVEQKRIITESQENVERMATIVDELLETARIDAGTFTIDIDSVNLDELVKKVIVTHTRLASEKQIKIQARLPSNRTEAKLDRTKIFETLSVFLENAIQYSPNDSEVQIVVTEDAKHIVVSVSDQGIGISKKDQKKLFTKFGRSRKAQKRRPDGLGLGLYLAKNTIEAHSGELIFSSRVNHGSTFGFRIPVE